MSASCAMKTSGCKFRLRTSCEVPERLLPMMKSGRINNVEIIFPIKTGFARP